MGRRTLERTGKPPRRCRSSRSKLPGRYSEEVAKSGKGMHAEGTGVPKSEAVSLCEMFKWLITGSLLPWRLVHCLQPACRRLCRWTQPCTAAPLSLKHDGRFELRGWEGKYEVSGEWVELSDSLLKTRVKIEPGHKMVLRFYGKQGLVEIFYERRRAELGKMSLG